MSNSNSILCPKTESTFDVFSDKQAEQEHKNIFIQLEKNLSLIPSAFYWKDRNHRFLGVNKVALQYVNFQSADQICGKTDYEIWPAEYAEKYIQDDLYVLETGQILSKEDQYLDSAGNVKYCQVIKVPLYDSKNNIIGIIGNSIDITLQKEAIFLKRETGRQQIILQEQEKFRKIVGKVAHDIGSPLASLAIMLKLDLTLPEQERIMLNDIATRISDIAANLLSYYRPKTIATELAEKRKPVLVYLALLNILAEKRYQYQGRQVSFETDFQLACHFVFIELEECAFKCMLSNLINNAVDALEEQPGVVALSFSVDNGVIKITIQDSGKGMSAALIEKITSNITVTEGKENGHGIGLMQVHETLERNQGTFTIDSKIGQGTTITLTFPVCPAPAWIVEQITLNNKDTVVILDDEPTIHTAWAAHFKRVAPEIELVHFTQADEALEFISGFVAQEQIMLLTDYELLKQPYTGLEVIEQAQINHVVLVTSHYADPSIQKQAIQLGVTILPKQLAAELSIQLSD